jgi:hypothetical protein
LGHVDHHRSQFVAVNELGELEVQQVQKARGDLHLARSVGAEKSFFGFSEKFQKKY